MPLTSAEINRLYRELLESSANPQGNSEQSNKCECGICHLQRVKYRVVEIGESREYVCRACYYKHTWTTCQYCGRKTLATNNFNYCNRCFKANTEKCDKCGEYFRNYDIKHVDDKKYCRQCVRKMYKTCFGCGGFTITGQLDAQLNEFFCNHCYTNRQKAIQSNYALYGSHMESFKLEKSKADKFFNIPLFTGCEIEVERTNNFTSMNKINVNALCNKTGCKLTHDGSLANGFEIVTRPAQSADLYNLLRTVTKGLQKQNLCIKRTCGLHVHIGARHLSHEQVKKIARFYMLFEDILFSMLPTSRTGNKYCIPVAKNYKLTRFYEPKNLDSVVYDYDSDSYQDKNNKYCSKRYSALNLHSYFYRGTIEFRHHSGTMNFIKIKNWIRIIHLIIDNALKVPEGTIKNLRKHSKTKRFDYFKTMIGAELSEYVIKRIAKFKNGATDDETYTTDISDAEINNLF